MPNMLRKWAGIYLGTSEGENDPGIVTSGNNYSEPLLSNASWWQGAHREVKEIWIFTGEDEVFANSLHAFGDKICKGWVACRGLEEKITLEVVENEAHVRPIMDVMLQYKEKSETQLGLEAWLKKILA